MIWLSLDRLPNFGWLPSSAIHLTAGIGVGWLYFTGLRWSARQLASGLGVRTIAASMGGRFILLGGLLFLTSLEGALPLLTMALGILIARAVIVRHVRQTAP